jgi:hypothetical protein
MHLTEPLPCNYRRDTHRVMGGNYEVSRSDSLKWHDVHAKFHRYWFRGDTQTDGDRIILLQESRLKRPEKNEVFR